MSIHDETDFTFHRALVDHFHLEAKVAADGDLLCEQDLHADVISLLIHAVGVGTGAERHGTLDSIAFLHGS